MTSNSAPKVHVHDTHVSCMRMPFETHLPQQMGPSSMPNQEENDVCMTQSAQHTIGLLTVIKCMHMQTWCFMNFHQSIRRLAYTGILQRQLCLSCCPLSYTAIRHTGEQSHLLLRQVLTLAVILTTTIEDGVVLHKEDNDYCMSHSAYCSTGVCIHVAATTPSRY